MKVGAVEFEVEGTVDQTNHAVGKILATVAEDKGIVSLFIEA